MLHYVIMDKNKENTITLLCTAYNPYMYKLYSFMEHSIFPPTMLCIDFFGILSAGHRGLYCSSPSLLNTTVTPFCSIYGILVRITYNSSHSCITPRGRSSANDGMDLKYLLAAVIACIMNKLCLEVGILTPLGLLDPPK